MVVKEHVQTALAFLEAADREFDLGDDLQGSEKLWGAASHAVMAIAQERGWPFHTHGALRAAARRLAREYDDPRIRDQFSVAEGFHGNFYHHWMPDDKVESDRPLVREFVERVLTLSSLK